MTARDTIFALSTPAGRAALAVIRISGPDADRALSALAGRLPEPRKARRALLRDPRSGEALDQALILRFAAPKTVTGENVAEIHAHGGPAVVAGLLEALAALPGFRPAEPGEFTRRAFENGKLDLTAVEGLSDLLAAETAAQRRQALQQMDGALAALVERWRSALTAIMAHLEAEIDFPDEELEVGRDAQSRMPLQALRDEITAHLSGAERGERLRQGYQVALVGAPNAGKSSLLNALARRDVAIVTDEPGTTRDILDVHLNLSGYPVILSDMAGLRSGAGRIESLGIARARARAADAALRLFLIDAPAPQPLDPLIQELFQPGDLILRTKSDLYPAPVRDGEIATSSVTGIGLDHVIREIEMRAVQNLGTEDAPAFTRLRHRTALAASLDALDRAIGAWDTAPPELIAEDLRRAAQALGRITGRIDVEDILDIVFAEFCIGK